MGLVHNKNGFKCIEYDTANSCEKCDATLKPEIEWECTWVGNMKFQEQILYKV